MDEPALPAPDDTAVLPANVVAEFRQLRDEFSRFMLSYKFGMDEITTKVRILQEEFRTVHVYNPIEHVSARLKTPEGVLEKARRKGCEPTFEQLRDQITDIAGVRVTCSFVSDAYRVFDLLTGQHDIHVVTVKDYIQNPKPNGYRSLHAIVEVPVFLSDGPTPVPVEVQFRTIAMDFWASLEHKIYYKYDKQVPDALLLSLHEAATTAAKLDEDMERLHREVHGDDRQQPPFESSPGGLELSERVVAQLLQQRAVLPEP
ncbi:GTP pyrophosphokinase [Jiangella alba]|uniref:Putative GTP pyrophosphokinase n=1 Tax=Jiangella alba TaxID=561176 RepID=A0A1H5KSD1_9ACTN|nr:GTP pyrophosphokinase family protein [Jiangella alba]SEE67673.1 putative GTP pyrophosphokinase [Jiangella alba]